MKSDRIKYFVSAFSAMVWTINGLFCKVLDWVPRHEQIVGRITGSDHPRLLTVLIGIGEIGMAIWILSGIKTRANAIVQIVAVALMNSIEFVLVPDLLLWGRFNSLFAFLFIVLIYYNEFQLSQKTTRVV